MTEMIVSTQSKFYKPVRMRRKKWTRAQYDKAVAAGVFTPADKIELIEGELIQKMPIHPPHTTAIILTQNALSQILSQDYHVRSQQPIALSNISEPEPDLTIVAGVPRDFRDSHPQSALLVVEVSDSTLAYDRGTKASMYAKAGIADYWIVNINERVVEVYRDPVKVNGRGRYQTQLRFGEGESITPLAFENATIAAADLLP